MSSITNDEWGVVKSRFEQMPENMRISIGGFQTLTKDDIIRHIENKDETGELLVKMQMNYLKLFKKEVDLENEQ